MMDTERYRHYMNKKVFNTLGMALASLPATKSNRTNNKRRNVKNMESVSAAQMISFTNINTENPLIFCGKYNKAFPVLKQLIKKSHRPFVLIGTKRDLGENSCLRALDTEWECDSITGNLPDGNGLLLLEAGGETSLRLQAFLSDWDSHLIILCVGNGLQVDDHLLNLLNSIGHYILLSEGLHRSVKSSEGTKMSPAELLASMEYILVSAIGTAAKELQKVFPNYECERVTNTLNLSLHRDAPHQNSGNQHHRNGGGLNFGQAKMLESRNIFTQEDLTNLQDSNELIIHNAQSSHTWIARISS